MDEVARLPMTDRADLFTAAARRRGLTAAIIEKDFWVCWTLERVSGLGALCGRQARHASACASGRALAGTGAGLSQDAGDDLWRTAWP